MGAGCWQTAARCTVTMILPGETEAGTAGTQPCRGISRRAHRDNERGVRARSCAPNLHRIERPHALKIPARRAEYSLTENVASPFQAEPRQYVSPAGRFLLSESRSARLKTKRASELFPQCLWRRRR